MIRWLTQRLRRFRRDEDGAAMTLEFLILFPLFIYIFTGGFQIGIMNVRHAQLERAVDMAVRDLRLGRDPTPTHPELLASICNYAGMIPNCDENLHIEMERIDTATWDFREGKVMCLDRTEEGEMAMNFTPGALNDLMLITVCGAYDIVIPYWGFSPFFPKVKDDKHYPLVAMSAYVIEP